MDIYRNQLNPANDSQFIPGHGAFVPVTSQKPEATRLTHTKIQSLIEKGQQNSFLKAAFNGVKQLDLANQQDINYLGNFIHGKTSRATRTKVLDNLQGDITALKNKRSNLGGQANITENYEINQADIFRTLVGDSIYTGGILAKAIRMIENNPCLLKGELPKAFSKYEGYELHALKAALMYIAISNGAGENELKQLKGVARVDLKPCSLYINSKLCHNRTFYLPTSGYVLGQDQAIDGAPISDCSGLATYAIRQTRPDINFFKKNKLVSWFMGRGHDYKFMNRDDVKNYPSQYCDGPIKNTSGQRRDLRQAEINEANSFKKNNPLRFAAQNDAFITVRRRKDIKPGDIIVHRHVSHGRSTAGGCGHVAIVADYSGEGNMATFLEFTRGESYNGLGFTRRQINYGPDRGGNWETRIFRPRSQ